MKKLFLSFLSLALLIGVLPASLGGGTAVADDNATSSFQFPGETFIRDQARISTSGRISLNGTIVDGIDPTTITYSVYQIIDASQNRIGQSKENLTNHVLNGRNLSVPNLELFPGLNEITFSGYRAGGETKTSIYIVYRNAPLLSDLVANLNGQLYPIHEVDTTVVHSSASMGQATTNITLTGYAPNADKVTIEVDGKSWDFFVTNSSNYQFAASPIPVKKGKNRIKFTVETNGHQTVTERDVAFYNGEVTFYDLMLSSDRGSEPLEYTPNLLIDDKSSLKLAGEVIIPAFNSTEPGIPSKPNLNDPSSVVIDYLVSSSLTGTNYSSGPPPVLISSAIAGGSFYVYKFEIPLSTTNLDFDKAYFVNLRSVNFSLEALGQPKYQGVERLQFSLRNAGKPYISNVNYLNGYKDKSDPTQLTGTKLDGANIYDLPLAVEVIIENAGSGGTPLASVSGIKNVVGTNASSFTDYKHYSRIETLPGNKRREIIIFGSLPFEGTQTLTLDVEGAKTPVTFTMLFGPYIEFDGLYDQMIIQDDTNLSESARIEQIVQQLLKDFSGNFSNINDRTEIRYAANNAGAQTVYFYLNNLLIELEQVGTDVTRFQLPKTADQRKRAFGALFDGENEARIVFTGKKNSYTRTVKFFKASTNIPVIPVEKDSIYPYSSNRKSPYAFDPDFTNKGAGVFTTKKPDMHVYGTFDFIDLRGTTQAALQNELDSMTNKGKYLFKIASADSGNKGWSWSLNNRLNVVPGKDIHAANSFVLNPSNSSNTTDDLEVYYHLDTKTFSFVLSNQKLHIDGSSSVYLFTVYNNGEGGPRASYRLEVDPTSLPYDVVRPFLDKQRTINQNFVEVIIEAPGAETVTVNGGAAERVEIDFTRSTGSAAELKPYYRYVVTGLKENKDNVIKYTIKWGNESVTDQFSVYYAPAIIPGAQVMQTMKSSGSSHSVFDKSLSLKFNKNSTLIRSDYNAPQNSKNQVYANHGILFAIANPDDGIVDRREFETKPAGYNLIVDSIGTRFKQLFPSRMQKASPVYWIDGGEADDLQTEVYDAIKQGRDPYQFPGNKEGPGGSELATFENRDPGRELVLHPDYPGTLTLKFDRSAMDSAGVSMTVLRYNSSTKEWENLGGTVDVKNNTITIPFYRFGYYAVGKLTTSFLDISSHPYARNHMDAIYTKGVMNAYGFDEFGANRYINRGEFAAMIVRALRLPLNYSSDRLHFDDVPAIINPSAPFDYRHIETAARAGIIEGSGPRTFQPYQNLTREQAAAMLARALNIKLATNSDKVYKDLEKAFSDAVSVYHYFRPEVLAIQKAGYIKGSPVDPSNPKGANVFEPKANLLRSDAATIMARVMAARKTLPAIY